LKCILEKWDIKVWYRLKWSTESHIQWVPEVLSLGIKPPVCEADHSLPSVVEVKNGRSYTSNRPLCLHGVDERTNHYDVYISRKYHADNSSLNKHWLAGRAAGSGYGTWWMNLLAPPSEAGTG
jgi:hypothetical protein